jgi:hypothetical protein
MTAQKAATAVVTASVIIAIVLAPRRRSGSVSITRAPGAIAVQSPLMRSLSLSMTPPPICSGRSESPACGDWPGPPWICSVCA